jgi:hypothetical protein
MNINALLSNCPFCSTDQLLIQELRLPNLDAATCWLTVMVTQNINKQTSVVWCG